MKEYKNIDELFKQGMSGLKTEPSDAVWKNIESGFFQGRGFVFRWYHAALIILLLAIGGGIWYYTADSVPGGDEVVNNEILPFEQEPKVEKDIPAGTKSGSENWENDPITDEGFNETQSIVVADKEDSDYDAARVSTPDADSYTDPSGDYAESLNMGVIAAKYDDLYALESKDIKLNNDLPVRELDPDDIPGMQKYLEKQRHTHFYTGITAHAGMIYYPDTKDQFTWSSDLAMGLKIGKFNIESGVGYESMQEEGQYIIELKGYDSVGYFNRVESFSVNPKNPDDIAYNTRQVTVYDSVDRYQHSAPIFKYKYVNIPLNVGYRFFETEKMVISASTGVVFNFLVESEMPAPNYYNPDYTVVRTRNVTPERVNWNMRWQISLRMNYQIARSLTFSVEPVFSKYINSIYDTDQGYPNVKPYTMGVRAGLFYGF